MLGIQLVDKDVLNVPMIAADAYGKFIPGPSAACRSSSPRVRPGGGDRRERRQRNAGARRCAVLQHTVPDGHRAQRGPVPAGHRPQPGNTAGRTGPGRGQHGIRRLRQPGPRAPTTTRCSNAHFIAGDGRVNENIGLTAIHQVFHSEHDRLVGDIKNVLTTDKSASGAAALAEWQAGGGRRRLERRAPLPGGTLHHGDGVPAPGLRGVCPQDPAGDQPLRAVRVHPDRHQPGHQRRIRPRRLPFRPLDADRDHLAPQRGQPGPDGVWGN